MPLYVNLYTGNYIQGVKKKKNKKQGVTCCSFVRLFCSQFFDCALTPAEIR